MARTAIRQDGCKQWTVSINANGTETRIGGFRDICSKNRLQPGANGEARYRTSVRLPLEDADKEATASGSESVLTTVEQAVEGMSKEKKIALGLLAAGIIGGLLYWAFGGKKKAAATA